MGIDDPLLPAAAHLTGPHAGDILRTAIEHAGGTLGRHRCSRLHYRPGRHLIAQFRADVDWGNGAVRRETIVAATTSSGPPAGTLAVTAEIVDDDLTVGVWRWPFDPMLPALERAVRSPGDLLAGRGVPVETDITAETVRYRPTERAVVRLSGSTGRWYLKLVRPGTCDDIVRRHRLLFEHGLPVPEVIASDAEQGWMLVTELAGPTLRDVVKRDADDWPSPRTVHQLIGRLAAIDGDVPQAFRSRLSDGPYHASLLASALPAERGRLSRLGDVLEAAAGRAAERPSGFVHGDLHEAQLIVAGGRITGLLDVDEAGLGDPIDDIAVPVAHLRHRTLGAWNAGRIDQFVDEFVALADVDHDPADVAAGTAAVLVGLATAPFRSQSDGWQERVGRVLDLVDHHLSPE